MTIMRQFVSRKKGALRKPQGSLLGWDGPRRLTRLGRASPLTVARRRRRRSQRRRRWWRRQQTESFYGELFGQWIQCCFDIQLFSAHDIHCVLFWSSLISTFSYSHSILHPLCFMYNLTSIISLLSSALSSPFSSFILRHKRPSVQQRSWRKEGRGRREGRGLSTIL